MGEHLLRCARWVSHGADREGNEAAPESRDDQRSLVSEFTPNLRAGGSAGVTFPGHRTLASRHAVGRA